MTKEAIIKQHPSLVYIIGAHGSGAFQLMNKAMDEYAKQQVFEFEKWKYDNKWIKSLNKGFYTKPFPDDMQVPFDELYSKFIDNQFIEQQNKDNG